MASDTPKRPDVEGLLVQACLAPGQPFGATRDETRLLCRWVLHVEAERDAALEALAEMVKWDSAVLPTPLYVVNAARALLPKGD